MNNPLTVRNQNNIPEFFHADQNRTIEQDDMVDKWIIKLINEIII